MSVKAIHDANGVTIERKRSGNKDYWRLNGDTWFRSEGGVIFKPWTGVVPAEIIDARDMLQPKVKP